MMNRDPLADELETPEVLGDDGVLTAETELWRVLNLIGPQPEFLAALKDYRRAVLVACARHHEVRPIGPFPL